MPYPPARCPPRYISARISAPRHITAAQMHRLCCTPAANYSWARSNITVEDVAQAESNTNDIDDNNNSSTEGSEAPTRKRQRCSKKSSGGKTAKEDAFWPRVDERLQALVNRFGPNLASGEWATYVLKLMSDEQTSVQRATVQTPTFADAFEQLTGTFDLSLFTPQPTLPDPAPALAMSTSNRRRTASPSPGRGPLSPHPRTVTPHLPSSRPVTPMNIPSRPAQHLQQQPALPPSPYLPPDYRSHQHPSWVPTHHHQLSFAPQRPADRDRNSPLPPRSLVPISSPETPSFPPWVDPRILALGEASRKWFRRRATGRSSTPLLPILWLCLAISLFIRALCSSSLDTRYTFTSMLHS
ncbi:hypothetical protein FA13DRAFT_1816244 [Coprinellus micaceus]|uniref:Uncharacterized protein n=1 Tax=Coprinellus micaceus TaxID=71717 RepID=A0A4Y7T167_COPMI|nr:hypothetical protein FA13DRAFT_1816244 [Coprinellus micaceus]